MIVLAPSGAVRLRPSAWGSCPWHARDGLRSCTANPQPPRTEWRRTDLAAVRFRREASEHKCRAHDLFLTQSNRGALLRCCPGGDFGLPRHRPSVGAQLAGLPRGKVAAASWRDYGAIILVRTLEEAVPLIDAIAARHPDLRLIIDHLGLVRPKLDHEAFAHLPALLALAKRPNIAVKASAVTDYSSEPYPFPILHGYLRQVFDACGPKRIFWGSDISRVRHPYRQMITLFTEELAWLGEDDKAWIMGRGLCEWLNWPLSAAAPV